MKDKVGRRRRIKLEKEGKGWKKMKDKVGRRRRIRLERKG